MIASAPGSLSIRATRWARENPFEVIHLTVDPTTELIPARWPAVRDQVKVEYTTENGVNICSTVRTMTSAPLPKPQGRVSRGEDNPTATPPFPVKTVIGEVVASSSTALSIRASGGIIERVGELLALRIDRRTKFPSSLWPAAGMEVEVGVRDENGVRFADSVTVPSRFSRPEQYRGLIA